jgi:hypothetical protein
MKKYLSYVLAAMLAATACAPAQMEHTQSTARLAASTTVQFKYSGNHIFLPATVDGKTFAFVFDTAGAASLAPSVAKSLALPTVAKAQIYGAGSGIETMDVVRSKQASIGDARLDDGMFLVLPTDLGLMSPYPNLAFGGVLGREFFAHLVLTIDYANRTLTLTNPSAFRADPKAIVVPMTMRMGVFPNVDASVDGVTGTFDVDAGSGAGLSLTQSYADANGIVAKMPRTVNVTFARGIGGLMTGTAGRIRTFTIGGITFDRAIGTVVHATGGAFATPGLAGNIGADILRRFTVTIDAPGHALYLSKNDAFGQPFTFTRTGMFVDHASGAYVVADVAPDSPAQRAGIRAGDVLVAVDGKAASSLTVDQLKEFEVQPPGTVVHVNVLRAGRPLTFEMRLADLL